MSARTVARGHTENGLPGLGLPHRLRAGLAGGALVLGLGLSSTAAQAFCRTTACDPSTECEYDVRGCAIVGAPLEWKSSCVSYSVHRGGSQKRGISHATVHDLSARAFRSWTEADCGSGSPSISVEDRSPVLCGEPEYNSDHGNANVIMFRDNDWPYAGASATLALTTITFNPETGEIFDADIEINSFKTPLTTGDVAIEYDLQSILTHETGHFLGLSHTLVEEATMYLEYSEGTSLRNLHADDVDGICSTYPPTRDVQEDSCEPRHGFSPDCKPPPDDGCSLPSAPGSNPPSGSPAPWLCLAFGAFLIARARRQARA